MQIVVGKEKEYADWKAKQSDPYGERIFLLRRRLGESHGEANGRIRLRMDTGYGHCEVCLFAFAPCGHGRHPGVHVRSGSFCPREKQRSTGNYSGTGTITRRRSETRATRRTRKWKES